MESPVVPVLLITLICVVGLGCIGWVLIDGVGWLFKVFMMVVVALLCAIFTVSVWHFHVRDVRWHTNLCREFPNTDDC